MESRRVGIAHQDLLETLNRIAVGSAHPTMLDKTL